ncbi:MAG: M55 family metallopeptidase [Gemmatimonadota bacterium]|nr:M55 family metallopeptidase [Gemmatimonadota bacterium]
MHRSLLAALLLSCAAPALAAQKPVRVYISVDMEGIAGVVSTEQLGPTGFEYQKAREWMTAETLAAIAGAREAGATEFVVSDSHGNGLNLLIDQFPADVRIVRSWPRPLGMMEGIDSTFDAVLFIGYHASTNNPNGVRAHTFSSAHLASVELNGTPMMEAGVNAAIAGRFGVPVVMMSGDDVAIDEVRKQIGDIEGAVVKRAISFHAANTMTPAAAQALVHAKAKAGVARRASLKPFVVKAPVRLEITFKNYRPAEVLAYLPNVQRITSHTIRIMAKDMIEVSKFIEFIDNYDPNMTP